MRLQAHAVPTPEAVNTELTRALGVVAKVAASRKNAPAAALRPRTITVLHRPIEARGLDGI